MTAGGDPPVISAELARENAERELAALEYEIGPQLWQLRKLIIICLIASCLAGIVVAFALWVAGSLLERVGFSTHVNSVLAVIYFLGTFFWTFSTLWARKIAIPFYKGVWQAPEELLDRLRKLMQSRADLIYALRGVKVSAEPDLLPWSWLFVFLTVLLGLVFYVIFQLP